MPSAKRSVKELKAANGGNCTIYKDVSKAAGVNKPNGSEKARADGPQ